MRFIDEATIRIAGGHGGPGCVSFRRETFIPRGGPDGGDGGDGGSVIFQASAQLGTLQDFRFKRVYQAEAGSHGSGANKAGRDGEDILIRVPVGTVVRDANTGETLIEFMEDGQSWTACKGGRGGKGNAHFTTSTHQAPKFAQPGEEGTSLAITLELKLLADVGIIGFPNAGKSTLISRISAARPKIADYPFTTLVPNLGVVSWGPGGSSDPSSRSFVVADIPGLVEGAHEGAGLGHKFLRHIERTRLFVHLLDGARFLDEATRPDDPAFDQAVVALADRYAAIRRELGLFNEALLYKPEIVVLNKLDVLDSDPVLVERAREALRGRIAAVRAATPGLELIPGEPFVISAATGSGVPELLSAMQKEMDARDITRKGATTLLPDDEGIRA